MNCKLQLSLHYTGYYESFKQKFKKKREIYQDSVFSLKYNMFRPWIERDSFRTEATEQSEA